MTTTIDARIQRLFEIAKLLFPIFVKTHEEELRGKKGVYLMIRPIGKQFSDLIYSEILGEVYSDEIEVMKDIALDQIDIMKRFALCCSFEGYDTPTKKRGGGITASDFYVVPIGLPNYLNQKFAQIVCVVAEEITFDICFNIDTVSDKQIREKKH